jgi:hypothetical protein
MDAFVVVSVTNGVADGRYASSIMRGKDAHQLCERLRSDAKLYKVVPMIDSDYIRVRHLSDAAS